MRYSRNFHSNFFEGSVELSDLDTEVDVEL